MNNSSSCIIDQQYEDIVVNPDGEVYNPIDLKDYTFLMTSKLICCSVGIPLNLSIAITIIRYRRLHNKPRNIFLLGIIFSYLTFFVPAIIELIYWELYPVQSVCQSYVAVVGVPYGLLLVFLLELIFIFKLVPLRCEVWLSHVKISLLLLFIPFRSRLSIDQELYLRETRTITSSSNNEDVELTAVPVNDPRDPAHHVRPLAIHVDREILTRIEMEATRTLIIGVTSLVVTGLPYVIFISLFYLCRFVNHSDCSHFNWLAPLYMKDLGLIHAVYSPFIFLARNKEKKP